MGGDEGEAGEVEEGVQGGGVRGRGDRGKVQDRGHEAYHCHPLTSTRSVFTSPCHHNL